MFKPPCWYNLPPSPPLPPRIVELIAPQPFLFFLLLFAFQIPAPPFLSIWSPPILFPGFVFQPDEGIVPPLLSTSPFGFCFFFPFVSSLFLVLFFHQLFREPENICPPEPVFVDPFVGCIFPPQKNSTYKVPFPTSFG